MLKDFLTVLRTILFAALGLFFVACGEEKPVNEAEAVKPISVDALVELPADTSQAPNRDELTQTVFQFPYELSSEQKRCKLPGELEEVSGLGMLSNGNLALIQDEKGKIYEFSLRLVRFCQIKSLPKVEIMKVWR